MLTPAPGPTLTGSSDLFSWTDNGLGVGEWWLYVGSRLGAFDLVNSGALGTRTSIEVRDLPGDASDLHARLCYRSAPGKSDLLSSGSAGTRELFEASNICARLWFRIRGIWGGGFTGG